MEHCVLVCPIAYNEGPKIRRAVERFLASSVRGRVDYLVMDDGSTDETPSMLAAFAREGVMTLRHPVRSGVGAAIRTAIQHARTQGYRIIVIMAGNDKDNPDEIGRLIEPILAGRCHLVQGSRYVGGARIGGDMPIYRKWATRFHPWLMTLVTGRRITDSTNGFRAIDLALFDHPQIRLDQSWLDAYELEPYILYKALTLGFRVEEAPVSKIYPARRLGYTKMKPVVGWWSILRPLILLRLGIRT